MPTTLQPCNKRYFRTLLPGLIALGSLFTSTLLASESLWQPVEGQHYQRLAAKQTQSAGRSQLDIYCWAGSLACYRLEQALALWPAKTTVQIQLHPLVQRPQWRRLAKAQMVADTMGVRAQLMPAIYATLHDQQQSLDTDFALFSLVKAQGINAAQFEDLFYSQSINQALVEQQSKANKLGVSGVPTLIVNGQWYVDSRMVKSPRQIVATLDYLLTLES